MSGSEVTVSGSGGSPEKPETAPGGVARELDASGHAQPAARRAEIEKIMKTDIGRYRREGLDREYAGLLEAEDLEIDPDAGEPTRPMHAGDARQQLSAFQAGRQLVEQWDNLGGFSTQLGNAQSAAGAVVKDIGSNRDQRAFMERFDRDVPEAARLAIYAELAAGPPTFVSPASDGEVRLFAQTPAGKVLVAEWGRSAPDKVAAVRVRAARLADSMFDDEADEFWTWFDELPADTATAIIRKMAGG